MSVVDELLEALRDVADLDALAGLVSNDWMDRFCPPIRDWLNILIQQERQRRETGVEPEYSFPEKDFHHWPPAILVGLANCTVKMVEASVMVGVPAIVNFMLRLQQLLVASLGIALLESIANGPCQTNH